MSEKKEKPAEKKKTDKKEEDELEGVSYTYWKRDSDIKADHKGFQPQQAANPAEINVNQNKVGSAWNKAGTWEEKIITKKQFESFFTDYVTKNKKIYKDVFFFEEFSGYSGEVRKILFNFIFFINFLFQTYFVFSRGKIKFLYDCQVKVKIAGVKNFEGLSTCVTIKNLNNEDEDERPEFEYESGDSSSSSKRFPLVQNFKASIKEIEIDLRKIFEEMKNSMSK